MLTATTVGSAFAWGSGEGVVDALTILAAGLSVCWPIHHSIPPLLKDVDLTMQQEVDDATKPEPAEDYDDIQAMAESYLANIFRAGVTWVDALLPQFFGVPNGAPLDLVDQLYASLKRANLIDPLPGRSTNISTV
jgi:hypothetical protein